jgi:hypothetical protein
MGHGSGCFPSGHNKSHMYDHRTYQGRVNDGYVVPAYATYDDRLPQVSGSPIRMSVHCAHEQHLQHWTACCRRLNHAKEAEQGIMYATQELLDNISSLGADTAVHFDGRTRAPSINRAGRMPSNDGMAGGWVPNHHPMMDLHRAISVKGGQSPVPGCTSDMWC